MKQVAFTLREGMVSLSEMENIRIRAVKRPMLNHTESNIPAP